MRLDADDDSVKGRFGVATWKAAFCDCGEKQRLGVARRGVTRRGDALRGASAESLQMTRPPMYNNVSDTHHEKRWGKIFVILGAASSFVSSRSSC